jgi:hypothetical protein
VLQAFVLAITLSSGGGQFTQYDAVCYGKQGQPAHTYKCEFGDAKEGKDPQTCRNFKVVDVSIPHTSLIQADASVSCTEYAKHLELGLKLHADPRAPIRETESRSSLRSRIVFDDDVVETPDGEVYSAEELP